MFSLVHLSTQVSVIFENTLYCACSELFFPPRPCTHWPTFAHVSTSFPAWRSHSSLLDCSGRWEEGRGVNSCFRNTHVTLHYKIIFMRRFLILNFVQGKSFISASCCSTKRHGAISTPHSKSKLLIPFTPVFATCWRSTTSWVCVCRLLIFSFWLFLNVICLLFLMVKQIYNILIIRGLQLPQ